MSRPCSLKTVEVKTMINKKISSGAEQVLIGSLLGDGGLQIQKNGINANFNEVHSIKQKKYLIWKKEYLSYFKPKINQYRIYDNRTNKYYSSVNLWTKTNPILTEYFRLFYPKGKKRISRNILDRISPLALAVWYCDDGSFGYINQNGKIATYLSYKDNKLIAEFLKKKFNINCTVNRDKKRYYLYFSVKEIGKFLNLIKDHVPKCMNYKLGPFSDENLARLKEENLKRREKDKIRHKRDMENPIKHERINKQKLENHMKRRENPEYREKDNEYHRIWSKNYRKCNKEKYNEYHRKKHREYYWKKEQSSGA